MLTKLGAMSVDRPHHKEVLQDVDRLGPGLMTSVAQLNSGKVIDVWQLIIDNPQIGERLAGYRDVFACVEEFWEHHEHNKNNKYVLKEITS